MWNRWHTTCAAALWAMSRCVHSFVVVPANTPSPVSSTLPVISNENFAKDSISRWNHALYSQNDDITEDTARGDDDNNKDDVPGWWKQVVEPGDTVICKREIPSMGIYENKSYQLVSLYRQSFDESTQTIQKIPLESLPTDGSTECYMTLFNPKFQKEPVIVTPEEVGLVSVRNELISSMWLAVPGFFWVFVAASFYNIYHERTGGSFMDAFLGR